MPPPQISLGFVGLRFQFFLAVQDSSIGDLVTHSLSRLPFDFSYNNINYNVYRHSDLDLD